MRVVFAHDHVFSFSADGVYYTSGKLPYVVWNRYLEHFSSMSIVSRAVPLVVPAMESNLNVSSGPSVKFVPIPSLSDHISILTKRAQAIKLLNTAIGESDALIARLPSSIGLLAVSIAEELKKPWAVEVVGCPWDAFWNYGNLQGKIYAPISWFRTRAAVKKAPFAMYVTKDFLQGRYPCKGQIARSSNVEVPCAVVDTLAQRLVRIDRAKDTTVIGCIGSLSSANKGIDTVLKALSFIKDKIPKFEFRVLGGGDPEHLLSLARSCGVEDVTRFCGTLPAGAAVFEWLDGVDLYLQPSRQEGLPRSLIEAMSRGCPALGSTAGGIPELLPEYLMIKPGDSQALSVLIQKVLLDKASQKEYASRNFEEAKLYSADLLNAIRNKFWADFKKFASRRR